MKVFNRNVAGRYLSAQSLKRQGKRIKLMIGGGFIVYALLLCCMYSPAKASDNGTIPSGLNKVYLPLISNTSDKPVTDVNEGPTPTDPITVTYNVVYVNTTITKTEKAALNYLAMTNTKTMTNVTQIKTEFGDMKTGNGLILDNDGFFKYAKAYVYHYHTATKDQQCAQMKIAVKVGENKYRNVIGRACYDHNFTGDYDRELNDLYNAVNDQVELLNP